MFQVAICDDEAANHNLIKQLLLILTKCTHFSFDTYFFSSGEELLEYYKTHKSNPFHILFLDIEMNGINGINTAKQIRSLPDRDVQIIFLTSYPEYMMDSFDVQTFHYLIKPISNELFISKVTKLCNYILASINRYLTIKTNGEYLVLKNSAVIAITKVKNTIAKKRLEVITTEQRYACAGTLESYSNRLEYPFLLVHRSVIINMEHVLKFTVSSVVMSSKEEFPIGRSKAQTIKDSYARYMLARIKQRG